VAENQAQAHALFQDHVVGEVVVEDSDDSTDRAAYDGSADCSPSERAEKQAGAGANPGISGDVVVRSEPGDKAATVRSYDVLVLESRNKPANLVSSPVRETNMGEPDIESSGM
jgi:hypothetical protein